MIYDIKLIHMLYDIPLIHDSEVGYFCEESNHVSNVNYNKLLVPFGNLRGWFNFKCSFKHYVGTTAQEKYGRFLKVNLTKDGA